MSALSVASSAYRDTFVVWFVMPGRHRRDGTLHRKPQPEARATAGKVLRRYGATVRFHDRLDDREAYPGAVSEAPLRKLSKI